jgi:hypothetical protein
VPATKPVAFSSPEPDGTLPSVGELGSTISSLVEGVVSSVCELQEHNATTQTNIASNSAISLLVFISF